MLTITFSSFPNFHRYVRFNVRLWHGAYKEVWKSYDTNEGVEVAWNTLSLKNIPRQDKKRIIHEIRMLEKVSFQVSYISH